MDSIKFFLPPSQIEDFIERGAIDRLEDGRMIVTAKGTLYEGFEVVKVELLSTPPQHP